MLSRRLKNWKLDLSAEMQTELLKKYHFTSINSFMAAIGDGEFDVSENQRAGTYEITMKLSVPSNLELDKVVSQIRAIRQVLKVTRT